MALSHRDALTAAQEILRGARTAEAARLDRIRDALKPDHCTVVIPQDANASSQMQRLALKARTNVLPLVVKTFSQVMKVEGYSPATSRDNGAAWEHWQRNGMDARQTGIHRSALAYGVSYATVLPGDTGPVIEGFSPRNMTALYQNPNRDEWPMLALEVDGPMMRLYDEEAIYLIGDETRPRSGIVAPIPGMPRLEFIETRHHDIGHCPIVRYRDRMLLEGEEQYGIVEPIMSIQERIDETTFGMLVAQFYAAFKQRYIIGWVGTEEEEMKASAADFWTFQDPDVKVGQFDETDLTRYLESKDSAFRDMAAISQVPAQNLGAKGISNISAEALAAMEAGKDREAEEITTSLGESHEQLLRLAAYVDGDSVAANDHSAQVRWKNATARSLAQTADALGKMVQMLGVPEEGVWRMIPGVTQTDIDAWKSLRAQGDAFGRLSDLLAGQQDRAVTG